MQPQPTLTTLVTLVNQLIPAVPRSVCGLICLFEPWTFLSLQVAQITLDFFQWKPDLPHATMASWITNYEMLACLRHEGVKPLIPKVKWRRDFQIRSNRSGFIRIDCDRDSINSSILNSCLPGLAKHCLATLQSLELRTIVADSVTVHLGGFTVWWATKTDLDSLFEMKCLCDSIWDFLKNSPL